MRLFPPLPAHPAVVVLPGPGLQLFSPSQSHNVEPWRWSLPCVDDEKPGRIRVMPLERGDGEAINGAAPLCTKPWPFSSFSGGSTELPDPTLARQTASFAGGAIPS